MSKADMPVEVVVGKYTNEDDAKAALKQLKAAKKEHLLSLENAAVVHKTEKGKVKISEMQDMGAGKGAAIGAVALGASALILPITVPAAAVVGGAAGALYAKFRDTGFEDKELKQVGASLAPGAALLIVATKPESVETVKSELALSAREVTTTTLSAEAVAVATAGAAPEAAVVEVEHAEMELEVEEPAE